MKLTIATPPPSLFMISVASEALPFGLMFAHTSSARMPTSFATAKAVLIPSPVIIPTVIPIRRNALIACPDDGFGASESDNARIGTGKEEPRPIETYATVRAMELSLASNLDNAEGSIASSDCVINLGVPTKSVYLDPERERTALTPAPVTLSNDSTVG